MNGIKSPFEFLKKHQKGEVVKEHISSLISKLERNIEESLKGSIEERENFVWLVFDIPPEEQKNFTEEEWEEIKKLIRLGSESLIEGHADQAYAANTKKIKIQEHLQNETQYMRGIAHDFIHVILRCKESNGASLRPRFLEEGDQSFDPGAHKEELFARIADRQPLYKNLFIAVNPLEYAREQLGSRPGPFVEQRLAELEHGRGTSSGQQSASEQEASFYVGICELLYFCCQVDNRLGVLPETAPLRRLYDSMSADRDPRLISFVQKMLTNQRSNNPDPRFFFTQFREMLKPLANTTTERT